MEEGESLIYFYQTRGQSAARSRFRAPRLLTWTKELGQDRIEFCPVPEYCRREKPWETERLREILGRKLTESGAGDYYMAPVLCGLLDLEERLPPLFLLKRLLAQNSCWESLIYVGDDEKADDLLFPLLEDYLPRINHLTVITKEPGRYESFRDYIYEEYGIPAVSAERLKSCHGAGKRAVILDGRRAYRPSYGGLPERASYIDLWSEEGKRRLIETGQKDLHYLGTAKFLDTLVKSGYNTIVNRT